MDYYLDGYFEKIRVNMSNLNKHRLYVQFPQTSDMGFKIRLIGLR